MTFAPNPDSIGKFSTWAVSNREKIFRYAFIPQLFVGLILVCLGYVIGKDHYHLIRAGIRTSGKIVSYREKYFRDSSPSKSTFAFMPIVEFQASDRVVQFQDWMGTKVAVLNQPVVVLYDPVNPTMAMIDRPVWNWIPWAPTLGVGIFLLLVGIKGGLRSLQ